MRVQSVKHFRVSHAKFVKTSHIRDYRMIVWFIFMFPGEAWAFNIR